MGIRERVVFPKGKQKQFLDYIYKLSNLPWKELGLKLDVNSGTLFHTYKFEQSNIPYSLFLKICETFNLDSNEILKQNDAKISNEDRSYPRKTFGETRKKLREINITFINKNNILNNEGIIFSKKDEERKIKLPNKITPELAEEVGMHLGDGFLSGRKTEYRLKGNKDEKDYYDTFIKGLYKSLFNINLNIKEYEDTYGFEMYSKAIHTFKSKVLGLPIGRKINVKIPDIFKINDITILTSLLRGLYDTDGCITFMSHYNHKKYYPHITFAQKSDFLIKDIYNILKMLGFNPCYFKGEGYSSLSLYGYNSLKRYMDLIGFHNPKHLRKVNNWKLLYPKL
ncbi:MAG: LAGLIDADG family homing endonuclease [Candidatus Nanoarchaeia archaeon]|nr:LAGLIDADG family homing endonuclease [Candidatus Nanoarchaeia archaeon]MDD5588291.1 LAGLIDADG family homing endonuclease [Candidatus Nanoarchaeia archaeon]